MHIKWRPVINFIAKSCRSSNSSDHSPCQFNVSVHVTDDVSEPGNATHHEQHHQHQVHAPSFTINTQHQMPSELVEINDIACALGTNLDSGILGDESDIYYRQRAFGLNIVLEFDGQHKYPMTKTFSELALEAIKDSTIILLLCCATLSLLIGMKTNGPQEGLTDGAIVFLAIFIVVSFSLVCRFFKTRLELMKLQKIKRTKKFASVVRNGTMQKIPVSEVVVGDVVLLEAGNEAPADGILFIDHGSSTNSNPKCATMFTGDKVVHEGNCRMIVTAVGENTQRSKLIGTMRNDQRNYNDQLEDSKLQTCMDKMNSRLEKLCLSLSIFVLLVQLLRSFMSKSGERSHNNPDSKGVKNAVEEIMKEATKLMKKNIGGKVNGLITLLCILVFATRDGLPLGILVLFLCVSKRTKKSLGGATVQKPSACATMGLITTICIGKSDALALKHSEMAELWIGHNCIRDVAKEVNSQVVKILAQGIGINSSNSQLGDDQKDSLLFWAKQVIGLDMDEIFYNTTRIHDQPYYSDDDDKRNHCLSMLTRSDKERNQVLVLLHCRGSDPEFVLSLCSHYYDVDGIMQTLDEENRESFSKIFEGVASSSSTLHCFAFAYKQLVILDHHVCDHESPKLPEPAEKEVENRGLTFIGLVGLKNPYNARPEVRETVETFRDLSVKMKLVVEDDANTARIMALHSGIMIRDQEGAVIEASDFRKSSDEARMNMIENIRVMANSTPADKLLMVQCLRKKGEMVAITGSCITDSPSLLEADVGIFMATSADDHHMSCAEMAKEDAHVVINVLGKIAAFARLGRYVCKSIQNFLELHLILNISAFVINYILELLSKNEVQLTSIQLLYTNLIVETLGAFGLAMSSNFELIQGELLIINTSTGGPDIILITKRMWRNIAAQSLFQVTILMVLAIKGKEIFHVHGGVVRTMIFNCYVLCQVCILVGAIMKNKKPNNFQGNVIGNYLFLIMIIILLGVIVAMQVTLIEIMGAVAHWGKLDSKKWWVCFGIAAFSVPLSYAVN